MIYILCVLFGVFVGIVVLSLMAMSQGRDLEGEIDRAYWDGWDDRGKHEQGQKKEG